MLFLQPLRGFFWPPWPLTRKMEEENDGGVTEEVSRRHGNSSQPESQQIMAVLNAVKEVILAENLSVTPTALFAATMSALEKSETQQSAQVRRGLMRPPVAHQCA
jgi:hypothetical protein